MSAAAAGRAVLMCYPRVSWISGAELVCRCSVQLRMFQRLLEICMMKEKQKTKNDLTLGIQSPTTDIEDTHFTKKYFSEQVSDVAEIIIRFFHHPPFTTVCRVFSYSSLTGETVNHTCSSHALSLSFHHDVDTVQ